MKSVGSYMKKTAPKRQLFVVSLLVPIEIEVWAYGELSAAQNASSAEVVVAAEPNIRTYAISAPEVTAVRPAEKQVKK